MPQGQEPSRRILFFAYYSPPLGGAGSLRALSFARHLPENGWDLTILTPRVGVYGVDPTLACDDIPGVRVVRTESYEPATIIRGLRSKGAKDSGAGGDYVNEVRLGWVGSTMRGLARRWLYFPDSAIGWAIPAVREARRLHRERPFDLVFSSSPPVSGHLASLKFSKATGVPWIADWRDLWVSDSRSELASSGRARRLERKLLGSCAGLTGATDGVVRMQTRGRGGRFPAITVRNGFEPEDLRGDPPVRKDVFHVVYAGTAYGRAVQDMHGFFMAVVALVGKLGRTAIRVSVLGKCDPANQALPGELGISDVVDFEGFLPHHVVMGRLKSAGMVLLMGSQLPNEAGRAGVPAKTFECLASGSPVLLLAPPDTEVFALLKGVAGVTACGFDDASAIESAIRGAMTRGGSAESVPTAFLDGFTRSAQAERLSGFLEGFLHGDRPTP